jgi:hypothetical protein
MSKPFITGNQWAPSIASQAERHEGNPFWDRLRQMGQEMRVHQGDLERAISGAATAQEAKNLKRRLARRIVREGFPKIGPFETKAQIDRYLKGSPNGHTCLICGNAYRALGIHLATLHKVDLDEYRDQYRLPRTFGLACEETKAKHRELLEERIEAGNWRLMGNPAQAQLARSRKSRTAETEYKRVSTSARQRQFTDADFWRVIDTMRAESATPTEACARPGMPSMSTFRAWKAADAERQRSFSETVEALPFAKQAEMNMLGARYSAAVLALRHAGKTIDEIAAELGTDRMGISKRLRKLDPAHRQIVRHKTHCPKGHPYQERFTEDGRRIVTCRICSAENKRRAAERKGRG